MPFSSESYSPLGKLIDANRWFARELSAEPRIASHTLSVEETHED
jgi:hypothetical protein